MVIYNVKITVHKDIETDWFTWMSKTHIPDVINTGHFIGYKFMKLLQNGVLEPGYSTYQIQYECQNQRELDEYKTNDAPRLQKEHLDKYSEYFKNEYIKNVTRSEYEDMTASQRRLRALETT